MIAYFRKLYKEAEESSQKQIPWSVTNNGALVVDTEELVKREVFWNTVEQFKSFRENVNAKS